MVQEINEFCSEFEKIKTELIKDLLPQLINIAGRGHEYVIDASGRPFEKSYLAVLKNLIIKIEYIQKMSFDLISEEFKLEKNCAYTFYTNVIRDVGSLRSGQVDYLLAKYIEKHLDLSKYPNFYMPKFEERRRIIENIS